MQALPKSVETLRDAYRGASPDPDKNLRALFQRSTCGAGAQVLQKYDTLHLPSQSAGHGAKITIDEGKGDSAYFLTQFAEATASATQYFVDCGAVNPVVVFDYQKKEKGQVILSMQNPPQSALGAGAIFTWYQKTSFGKDARDSRGWPKGVSVGTMGIRSAGALDARIAATRLINAFNKLFAGEGDDGDDGDTATNRSRPMDLPSAGALALLEGLSDHARPEVKREEGRGDVTMDGAGDGAGGDLENHANSSLGFGVAEAAARGGGGAMGHGARRVSSGGSSAASQPRVENRQTTMSGGGRPAWSSGAGSAVDNRSAISSRGSVGLLGGGGGELMSRAGAGGSRAGGAGGLPWEEEVLPDDSVSSVGLSIFPGDASLAELGRSQTGASLLRASFGDNLSSVGGAGWQPRLRPPKPLRLQPLPQLKFEFRPNSKSSGRSRSRSPRRDWQREN